MRPQTGSLSGKEVQWLFHGVSAHTMRDRSGYSMLLHIHEGSQHNLGHLEDLWWQGWFYRAVNEDWEICEMC